MKNSIYLLLFCFFNTTIIIGQNVGVGVPLPSEKLEVAGIIYSNDGGIRFPDHTLQSTAYYNVATQDAANKRPQPLIYIEDVPGIYDTLGLEGVLPLLSSSSAFSSAGFPVNEGMSIVLNSDFTTVHLSGLFMTGTTIPSVDIFYIAEDPILGPFIYLAIHMTTVNITNFQTTSEYVGNGQFAQYDILNLVFDKISFTDYLTGLCRCWNFGGQSNTNCGC